MLRGGEEFIKMGRNAAESFLGDQTPLDDSIAKLAMELNDEQVKRVCQAANHAVNAGLLKSAEDGGDRYIDFKLADPSIVLSKIATLREKASRPDDYSITPESHFSPVSADPFSQEKTASSQEEASLLEVMESYDADEVVKEAELVLDKMVKARSVLIEKVASAELEQGNFDRDVDHREQDLYNEAKHALVNGESLEDVKIAIMASLGDMVDSEGIWDSVLLKLKGDGLVHSDDLGGDDLDLDVLVSEESGIFKSAMAIRSAFKSANQHASMITCLDEEIVGINRDIQKVAFVQGAMKKMVGKKVAKPAVKNSLKVGPVDGLFALLGPEKTIIKNKVI